MVLILSLDLPFASFWLPSTTGLSLLLSTAGESLSKAKHRSEQESEEDYEEFPRKKQKVSGE